MLWLTAATVAAPAYGSQESEDAGPLLVSGFEEVAVWGADPDGVTFMGPNGITIDEANNVYSTEFQGGHLRKFTPEGDLLLEVGGAGTDPGKLANPVGVAVAADGTVYVSESGSSRVSRFAADGALLSVWGSPGADPGQFFSAMGIDVSDAREVFVADFGNWCALCFVESDSWNHAAVAQRRQPWEDEGIHRSSVSACSICSKQDAGPPTWPGIWASARRPSTSGDDRTRSTAERSLA